MLLEDLKEIVVNNLQALIKKIKSSNDEEAIKLLRKAIGDDEMDGFSIVDDPDQDFENDDADKWLSENEGKAKSKDEPKVRQSRSKNWEARADLSPEEKKAIEEHMGKGFSEREAHRMAGTHKEHGDLQRAMKSGLNPSMMSDKMIDSLKPLVKDWLDNADRHEKINADVDKNPMKHASGQLMQAHETATGGYNKAYHDFLNTEDVSGLKGRDRFNAIKDWKSSWKKENPDYEAGLSNVSEKQKTFGDARQTAKANLQEKMDHIMRGGVSMPGVSATEAQQHLGQETRGEDMNQPAGTEDTTSSFASKNPNLVNLLNQDKFKEHKDRLTRVDSHANAGGVVRRRKGEGTE